VSSRLTGLLQAIVSFVFLIAGVVLAPFMMIGAWLRRRSVDFAPFLVYGVILFAFSALVSAVHVPNGTFIHSAVALAPHSYVLALEGVAAAVAWAAARRSNWNVEDATRVFMGGAVGLTMIAGVYFSIPTRDMWAGERDVKVAVGAALSAAGAPADDVVMSLDTGGVKYWTGHPGVVAPADPIETIERVARAYSARWLLVERRDAVLALGPILDGGPRPAWVGRPIWSQAQAPVPDAPGAAPLVGPDAALFPICLSPTDARCAP
jgi:hypothetical protein